MVAVRQYLNQAEADLGKLLLEEHGVFCELSGENAHLYGGAPFAMPITLWVADEQSADADRILNEKGNAISDDFDPKSVEARESVGLEIDETGPAVEAPQKSEPGARNDPWEILAVAGLLLIPAVFFLLQKEPVLWLVRRYSHLVIFLSVATVHAIGAVVLVAALSLVAVYFYVRRAIARERLLAEK